MLYFAAYFYRKNVNIPEIKKIGLQIVSIFPIYSQKY